MHSVIPAACLAWVRLALGPEPGAAAAVPHRECLEWVSVRAFGDKVEPTTGAPAVTVAAVNEVKAAFRVEVPILSRVGGGAGVE